MLRTFFLGLIGAGFAFIVLGMLLSLAFRRDDMSMGAWMQAGLQLLSDLEQVVRPDRLAVVRGCVQAGLLMVGVGIAMMSVDGMVVRPRV